ncbi:MAG: dynamin family protein [Ignavibacteriales bacterium]|nr:dynamin family protein [Ignavibacteriales bacterium]
MSIIDTKWIELYKTRLHWAYRAQDKFYASFQNENFKELLKDGSVNVALFGNSRVGKTTIILKLMGIKKGEEYFDKLYKVLRAKSPENDTSTKTAMVYLKSDDELFHYNENEKDELILKDEEELEEKLVSVKERVENNTFDFSKTIKIKIPNSYFNPQRENLLKVNVIDLPGYDSSNEKEQPHVQNVIRNLIPKANLILLVCNANSFADFLNNINISRIRQWKFFPKQFRIILTYCVSADSVRKQIQNSTDLKVEDFKKFYETEFFDKGTIRDAPKEIKIYPFEFGDSWKTLDNVMKEKTEGFLREIENELIQDINASSTEHNKIMMNSYVWKGMEKMIEKEVEQFNSEIGKCRNEIESTSSNIINIQSEITRLQNENSKIEAEKINRDGIAVFHYDIPDYNGEERVGSLENYLENQKNKIIECANNLIDNRDNFRDLSNNNANYLKIRRTLDERWDTIHDYYIKVRIPFTDIVINDKFSIDRKSCIKALRSIRDNIRDNIRQSITNTVNSHNKKLQKDISDNEVEIKGYELQITGLKNMLKKKTIEQQTLISERDLYIEQTKPDLEIAKNFIKFLHEEFRIEKTNVYRKINDSLIPTTDKILDFEYLNQISKELQKMEGQLQ